MAPTDLSIADGEYFVLIGPSGCGKTTLLRVIAGIERPTTGEVVLDGTVVNDVDAHGRDVAMVFQQSALYPNLTVAENIGFSLALAKVRKREARERVRVVAAMVEVDHLLDRRPMHLSGGERQRVAMARSLVRNPHLFLLDEPMSQLDAKLRVELRAELVRLQRRTGVTTVHVTHDQAEAMSMAQRLAVMRRGEVVQCGDPATVYEHPVDLFVGQFLGSPPMNAFVARAHLDDASLVLRWAAQEVRVPRHELGRFDLAAVHGREVVVGLRPDAFVVDASGPVTVSPHLAEQLGTHQLLHVTMPGVAVRAGDEAIERSTDHLAAMVVAAPADLPLDVWRPLHLSVRSDSLHLFDAEDGRSLERPLVGCAVTTAG